MSILKNGIAVFDSGIGGLTFLNECKNRIPQVPFYYYGDNLHAPYGNLPPQIIQKYVFSALEEIAVLSPRAVVLACNTATATCIDALREKYDFPIIGLEPAITLGAEYCKGFLQNQTDGRIKNEVFVLATRATCESERMKKLKERISAEYPSVEIILKPCERLAGEIENNILNPNFDFTPFFPTGRPTALVLGCTHYIYLKERLALHFSCPVFDGNDGAVRRLISLLSQNEKKTQKGRDKQPLATPTKNYTKNTQIYFLGDAKKQNQTLFEQMFANIRK